MIAVPESLFCYCRLRDGSLGNSLYLGSVSAVKFAFISPTGLMLPWWIKLQEEGHEVRVWIPSEQHRRIGDGMVEKAPSSDALASWGGEDAIYTFDLTSKGGLADAIQRSGRNVIGGASFLDKLEKDRGWSERVAQSLGLRLPRHEEFKSFSDAIAWIHRRPKKEQWFYKAGIDTEAAATYGAHDVADMVGQLEHFKDKFGDRTPGILQEKVNGVVIDTCSWWDGNKFLEPFIGMIEYKKFMPGEVGPNTGCEICWVWAYDKYPRIAKELNFAAIAELFKRMGIPPGEYGLNAIVSEIDKKPYFLEWDPRFGYDEDIVYLPGL